MPRRRRDNIVLVGFMGSGKTVVGRRVAELTGRTFLDTDEMIAEGDLSIPEIFAVEGEAGFRRRERSAIAEACRAHRAVIATGGGAVLDPANVRLLKGTGPVVYLRVGVEELHRRLAETTDRPLLDDPEPASDQSAARVEQRRRQRIERLLAERAHTYEAAANHVLDCDDLDLEAAARQVVDAVGGGPSTRRPGVVTVALHPPYPVTVGRGLLGAVRDHVDLRGAEKAIVITHPRVRRLWGDRLVGGLEGAGLEAKILTFPEGEPRKTPETVARLHRAMAQAGLHRSDIVVGLGGGVAGDVAGFAASTYQRGIPYVQVPTTLLAMVDAAIGGKTGVNLPEGKNLVGSFWQPRGVLADLDALSTLPERELRGGLAEVVKYALIADPSIGDLLVDRRDDIFARGGALGPIVERSARIKAEIVAEDERESGRRAILNYGHTLGHALESLTMSAADPGRRAPLHHGEAIAVGMMYAAWVAVLLGLADEDLVAAHLRLLDACGLPSSFRALRWEDVARYMRMDKKYAHGLRLVLLEAPGRPVLRGELPETVLRDALGHVCTGA